MTNKKVRNATSCEAYSLKFRSRMEKRVYEELSEAGFKPEYETRKLDLMKAFTPRKAGFIHKQKVRKNKETKEVFDDNRYKIQAITYTPDFFLDLGYYRVYIEVKGWPNDAYPLKKKLCLQYLEAKSSVKDNKYVFIEITALGQLKTVILKLNTMKLKDTIRSLIKKCMSEKDTILALQAVNDGEFTKVLELARAIKFKYSLDETPSSEETDEMLAVIELEDLLWANGDSLGIDTETFEPLVEL